MLKAVEGYRADVHVVYNMAEAFERKDLGWRRGWDSNPRWTNAHNSFRDSLLP